MALKLDAVSKVADGDKINNGVWTHFYNPDPTSEEPQFAGLFVNPEGYLFLDAEFTLPVRAKVRSHRCKLIVDAEERNNRDGMVKIRLAKRKERNKVISETGIIPPADRFAYTLAALENVSREQPGIQTTDMADGRAIYEAENFGWMVEQVNEVAYDDARFAADESTPVGNGSGSTTQKTPPSPPTQTQSPPSAA